METYINQLLEILEEAQNNRPAPRYMELPEEMEALRDVIEMEKAMAADDKPTMGKLFGVPQYNFPPEERLTDEQIVALKKGILDLWHAFHLEADFRKGEFTEREQYTKLVEAWKEYVPDFRGSNGTWHLEMFDYELNWDEDEMRYLTDEEYEAKHFPEEWDNFKGDDIDENELPL